MVAVIGTMVLSLQETYYWIDGESYKGGVFLALTAGDVVVYISFDGEGVVATT